jgi:uncharacterized membrane protein YdbT with pleckstrin-like domain
MSTQNQNGQIEINTDDEAIADRPDKPDKSKQPEQKKAFPDQFDDEEVLLVFRKHPVVMRKKLILSMVGLVLPLLPVTVRPELGMGWLVGGFIAGIVLMILIILPGWIAWYYSIFIVTNQRLLQITQKGLFHKSVVDLGLDKIQSINYQVSGLQQTMLRFGTIVIQTYMGDLVIHNVHHPTAINKKLNEILRDQGVVADKLHPEKDD